MSPIFTFCLLENYCNDEYKKQETDEEEEDEGEGGGGGGNKRIKNKGTLGNLVIQRNRKANGRVFHLESMYFRVTYISLWYYIEREKRFEARIEKLYSFHLSFFFFFLFFFGSEK